MITAGSGSRAPLRKTRTRPSRSATNTRPSGAMASAVGAVSSSDRTSSRSSAPSVVVRSVVGRERRRRGTRRRPGHRHPQRRRPAALGHDAAVGRERRELDRVGAWRHRRHPAAAREGTAARTAARDIGELDAIAVDVGDVTKRRELTRHRPPPDSSRGVRCRRCARPKPGGSDDEGGGVLPPHAHGHRRAPPRQPP